MKYFFSTLFFFLFSICLFAQKKDTIQEPPAINLEAIQDKNINSIDSLQLYMKSLENKRKKKKSLVDEESGKADYRLYKIISHDNDTVLIDTTLTILKDYKMNYLRRDLFELHSFQNQGQVFNTLSYTFDKKSILPSLGATAKHINYYEIEDIKYYEFPTPASEFLYRTGLEQGQVLDSRIAINFNKRKNFSLAYKGLRSLGNYRNSLSSHTNFRTTYSYLSKSERYRLRLHFATQELENQENGGLDATSLALYEDSDPEFEDRGRLDVNLENATSILIGKRYYFDHSLKLFNPKDTIALDSVSEKVTPTNLAPKKISNLRVGHTFTYETKQYRLESPFNDYFGSSFQNTTNDNTSHKSMNNTVYLDFTSPFVLGNFRVSGNYYSYFQGYKNAIFLNENNTNKIPSRLKGDFITVSAKWNANIKNIYFNAETSQGIRGSLSGNNLYAKAYYKNKKNTEIFASLHTNSRAPDLTYTLFQSNFLSYNWYNPNFKNVDTRNLSFGIKTKWIHATATATQIDNYLYFNADTQTKASQHTDAINYLKIKANNELKFWKFALNTTLLYQEVANGASVFRVPDFIGRSSFYFSDYLFKKKPLYLQTGFTVKYFSSYLANTYNAVVGDFAIQNTRKIGGKPILDFFVNGQIRRTRIYVKAENILSQFTDITYLSDPNTAYRDFTVRFGVVWNFFN